MQFRSDCYPQKVNGLVAAFLILVEHSLDLDRTLDTFEGIPTNSSKDCCVASNIVTSDVSIFQVLIFKKSKGLGEVIRAKDELISWDSEMQSTLGVSLQA